MSDAYTPYQPHSATSQEAADSVKENAKNLKEKVFQCIIDAGKTGVTDEEMQISLNMNPSTQRPRRIDLVKEGRVVESNSTRLTKSNRQAMVWVEAKYMPKPIPAIIPKQPIMHPDGSVCEDGTKNVPNNWTPCCKAFEYRTESCKFDIRFESRNGQWGIVVCDGGTSMICIDYCPHCGKKL